MTFRHPLAAFAVLAGVLSSVALAQPASLPEAPGKAELMAGCGGCHGVDLVTAQARTLPEWGGVVDAMVGYGATLTDAQRKAIVDYLSAHFGKPVPAEPPAATLAAAAAVLAKPD